MSRKRFAWVQDVRDRLLARQFTLPTRDENGDSRICHLCGRTFQASAQQVELASSSVSALTLPEAAALVFWVYTPAFNGCKFARWCCGEQSGWVA